MTALDLDGLAIKPFVVSVREYGSYVYHATSRGKALADAWRCDAFDHLTFKDFLKIARCWRQVPANPRFGDSITVNGRPAFFVESNRQYIRIAWPGSDQVSNAHPLEVKPIEYRPETYRSEKFDAQ